MSSLLSIDKLDLLARIDGWGRSAPDRIAFRSRERSLTYGQLLAGSDALAGWLEETTPPGPEPIALHGHKEPEMLIGFLAAWKAGRAYVPIDVSIPPQRAAAIVRESGAALVLTPTQIAEAVTEGHHPPARRVRPEDPCYLIFTSGSTGEPKGVLITHGNLRHFLEWMLAEQDFAIGGETFLNQANFSFDLSVMDLYSSLATGGTLFSLTREDVAEPAHVVAALDDSGLTTWVSTPSFVRLALLSPGFSEQLLPELRRFLFCGETLSPQTVVELHRRFPRAQVWNTYGPTEATVATTSLLIDEAVLATWPSLPVGRAMPGTRVLVLGDNGETVPDGTRGEIVIAGPNVSPGYVNSRERQARVFRAYQSQPAYYTGDLGQVRGGLIFCEGRADNQVKLHGYRIELGEIEAVLQALPEVAEAVVLAIARNGTVESLTAFVVLTEPTSAEHGAVTASLRAQLGGKLPSYMVPAAFSFLASFPLTANGKADRVSLARTTAEPAQAGTLKPADLAAEIASIWKDTLQVEAVRSEDNFFELGGDSLRAACALVAIEKVYRKELPVAFLYQHPTLGQLVEALTSNAPTDPNGSLITIQQGDEGSPPLFWLPGATSSTTVLLGNASYIFRLARNLGSAQTVYSVYQEHRAASAAPTIEKMAAHLLEDIVARQPVGPYYLAGWSFGALLAYEMARQLERAGAKVGLVALVDQTAPGYPQRRAWTRRPAAIWREWIGLSARAKSTFPVTSFSRFLAEEVTLLVRKWRRAFGQRNAWDRVIHLEDEYLTVKQNYPGPVTLFASRQTLAATEGSISLVHDADLGWSNVAGSVETHIVTGDHHTIFDEPGLSNITRVLSRHLAAAAQEAPSAH